MREIAAEPLTAEAFAPFGDVLEAAGPYDKLINEGLCGRWHDRARLDFGTGRAGISIFRAEPRALPYDCTLLERHPEGSQAFLPLHQAPFLVIVAPDAGGQPGAPRAFLTAPGQGINLYRGTWHGVLTPLSPPGLFAVVDRIGEGANLEEVRLEDPVRVTG
ncbi:ureidoglycolate lyase [Pseudoroseicyclus tamaricis]|uniref:Ureidoglycolate lyase n=1 Tax=Pseudoroseicyclus tamaricis TaxID=2705421 RepID=A0A6B2JVH0_9RHOB|nr:ureidoglycolate lyase [Pseudoroseicyclus tamaricis]NDV01885.1 ureidoglycolate lyase [Pseudoroseicyclus tamaricis]